MSERPNHGHDADNENVPHENQPNDESENQKPDQSSSDDSNVTWEEEPGTVAPEFQENDTVDDNDLSSLNWDKTAATVQPEPDDLGGESGTGDTVAEEGSQDVPDEEQLAKSTTTASAQEGLSDEGDSADGATFGQTADTIQPPDSAQEELSDEGVSVGGATFGQTTDTIQPPESIDETLSDEGEGDGDGTDEATYGQTADTVQPPDGHQWDEKSLSVTINARNLTSGEIAAWQKNVDTVNESSYFDAFFKSDRDSTATEKVTSEQETLGESVASDAVRMQQRELETVVDRAFDDDEIDRTVVGDSLKTRGGDDQETADESWDSVDPETVDGSGTAGQTEDRTDVDSETGLFIQQRDLVDPDDEQSGRAEFELLDTIGKGGMGIVYRANQTSMNRHVAIKMIKQEKSKRKKDRRNFLSEAVITGELDHPNIVPIYDVAKTRRNEFFYTMKEVKGTPWDHRHKEMTLEDNLKVLLAVCSAIEFAHDSGVSHCDLKPENIMLGDYKEVLVMDWGLAVIEKELAERKGISSEPTVGGTPAYMSPELGIAAFSMFTPTMMRQFKLPEITEEDSKAAIRKIGPATDIYLLGAILFEIIVGKPPHTGRNPYDCIGNAAKNVIREHKQTGELLDIAKKAMETKPGDRYASVGDFMEAIEEYQKHLQSTALQQTGEEKIEDAKSSKTYNEYQEAIAALNQSINVWEGNQTARERLSDVRYLLAERALSKSDFDLGLQQLENQQETRHVQLARKIQGAKDERIAEQRRGERNRKLLVAAALLIFVGVVGFGFWQNHKNNQLAEANAAEIEAKEKAIEEQKIAVAAKEAEKKQREVAEVAVIAETKAKEEEKVQRKLAQLNEEKAVKAQTLAEANEEKAVKAQTLAEASEKKAKENETKAVAAKLAEEKQRLLAETNEKKAVAAKLEEEKQRLLAETNEKKAVAAKLEEEKQRLLAQENEQKAIYESYVAVIGLADEKIRTNAFKVAKNRLTELEHSDFDSHRNWEYLRLKYVAELGSETDAKNQVNSVTYHPNGRQFAVGGRDGVVRIGLTQSPSKLTEEFKHGRPIHTLCYSNDGSLLATAGEGGEIKIWRVKGNELVHQLDGHESTVFALAISKDNRWLLSGSEDRTARLWDIKNKQELAKCWHLDPVRSVAFSNQLIQLKVKEGEPLRDQEGQPLIRRCIVTATASQDEKGGRAVVWSIDNGGPGAIGFERYRQFLGHGKNTNGAKIPLSAVYAATFTPDGTAVVSSGADRRILNWNLTKAWKQDALIDSIIKGFQPKPTQTADLDTKQRGIFDGLKDRRSVLISGGTLQDAELADAHAGTIRSLSFSHDGNYLVSSSDDFTVKVWDFKNKRLVKRLRGHRGFVTSAVFSPTDWKQLVSGSLDQSIRVWNVSTHQEERTLPQEFNLAHNGAVVSATFDAAGEMVLTASRDHKAKLWDVETGKVTAQFEEGSEESGHGLLFFQQKGKSYVLTGADDGTTRIWDAARNTEVMKITRTGRGNTLAAISADGRLLVTGSSSDETGPTSNADDAKSIVKLWDLSKLGEVDELNTPQKSLSEHEFPLSAIDLSRDGNRIVSGDVNGSVILWERGEDGMWTHERILAHPSNNVTGVQFVANERLMVTCGGDGRVILWDASSRKSLDEFTFRFRVAGLDRELTGSISKMAISTNEGSVLALCSYGLTKNNRTELQLLRIGDRKLQVGRRIPLKEEFTVESMVFQPRDDALYALTSGVVTNATRLDPVVKRWNLQTGQEELVRDDQGKQHSFLTTIGNNKLAATVRSLNYSPDGSRLYTLEGHVTRERDAQTRKVSGSFEPHKALASASFSNHGGDKRYVATADSTTIKIWPLPSRKPANRGNDLPTVHSECSETIQPSKAIKSVQFGPEPVANLLLTTHADNSAMLWQWNAAGGKLTQQGLVVKHSKPVNSAVFSSNGKWILTASDDGTARIWDMDGKQIKSFQHSQTERVLSAVFSDDADRIITCGTDDKAVVWLVATNKQEHVLEGHNGDVTCAAFSPDQKRIITGSIDRFAKIWDANKGAELLTLSGHVNGITSVGFSAQNDTAKYALTSSRDNTARIWLIRQPKDDGAKTVMR